MKFDPLDVLDAVTGSSSGRTGRLNRYAKLTSCSVRLAHKPSGIVVEGAVPTGRYSKKRMRTLRDALHAKLMLELKAKVEAR